jgi:hypothetical protein
MNVKKLVSFPTSNECINYLVSIGCIWSVSNERAWYKNGGSHEYQGVLVFHDPYLLLES